MEAAPPPSYLIAAAAVWPVVCACTVGLRFYARRALNARLLWDDWLTVPALILTWGIGGVVIAGTVQKSFAYPTPPPGPGQTAASNTAFQAQNTRELWWAFELLQIPMLGCVKLSFVLFYRRLFCTANGSKAMNIATITVVVLTVMWILAAWLALLFVCGTRFSAWWTSVEQDKLYCPNTLEYQMGMGISDTIMDIIIFILPIAPVYKLHMSTKRKLATVAIFGMGLVTIAASLTRMVIFIKAIAVDFTAHQDNDLLITGALYWSVNESGFALLSACLPIIYGLFKVKFGQTKSNRSLESYGPRSRFRSRWGSAPVSMNRKHGVGSNASDIHMVDYSSSPAVTRSTAARTNKNSSEDPEQGQIRVVKDVHVISQADE